MGYNQAEQEIREIELMIRKLIEKSPKEFCKTKEILETLIKVKNIQNQ